MTGRTVASTRVLASLGGRPLVVCDLPVRLARTDAHLRAVAVLAGRVDAVLIGEPPSVRMQLPPAYRAALLVDAGLPVWASLSCRDRNRVALEGELVALADAGAGLVHCITGDGARLGREPRSRAVDDLGVAELVALARDAGHAVSAAAAPATESAERFAAKAAAGADVAFLNLAPSAEAVHAFLADASAREAARPAVACIPFVVDAGSARVLGGHHLPDGLIDRVLASPDPRAAGIAAAVALARASASIQGVVGVCLSGGGAPGREQAHAEALAEGVDAVREALAGEARP